MKPRSTFRFLALSLALVSTASFSHAASYVDLGGLATGYLAVANFKNSGTQDGIENKNGNNNGLPGYANYRMANGNYTAIIASPQSTTSDYSAFASFSSGTFGGAPISINNQINSDANFSTMSAGRINYDNQLITGVGTETIPVSALTFDFNTYEWDGITQNGYNTNTGTSFISPFSTVDSIYNDGGGAGNAPLIYKLSVSNLQGGGLTFQNGVLTSMDFTANLAVAAAAAQFPTLTATFNGTLTGSGLGYQFNVADTKSIFIIQNAHMLMNRSGTASVVPEPTSAALAGLASLVLLRRRRAR